MPLELSSAAAELDYLAGPHGVGVQAVIMDCPATGAAWLRSHDWCNARIRFCTLSPGPWSTLRATVQQLHMQSATLAAAAHQQIGGRSDQRASRVCREGTRPQAQAAPGAIGALTGQPSGGGWLSSSVYSVPDWEAAAAAALVVCLGASAAGFAVWLRRRRNNLTRCGFHPFVWSAYNHSCTAYTQVL